MKPFLGFRFSLWLVMMNLVVKAGCLMHVLCLDSSMECYGTWVIERDGTYDGGCVGFGSLLFFRLKCI